ncbi:MAG: carbohydrate kinase [Bacteroidetes bacterium]|nr:MAG: carbohydrate kinase [Bacteroidota bacterium]
MLLLGIDIGTSSIKVSIVNANNSKSVASAHYPETEAAIISHHPGWAEQEPETWWEYFKLAFKKAASTGKFKASDIKAIGIAYQMHGLVIIDKNKKVLRPSIIWCDSRAVEIGNKAFHALGEEYSLIHYLNSPGNFTASKLAWVKANEPDVYGKVFKMMLPGDYLTMKLTGEITTSASALSEGILWDFQSETPAKRLMDQYGFTNEILPEIKPVFIEHGLVTKSASEELGLPMGIPVSYKAGDQPNNALSLNVLEPGEVAATAGTSGVIYAVSDQANYDPKSRVNSFAHVNHDSYQKRIGILLCINGTGIMNRWIRDIAGKDISYGEMNSQAESIPLGSEGLLVLPFGNGAERMLENKMPGAQFSNMQFTVHGPAHLFRAVQEGIACAFRYGLDIMRENGLQPSVIRAGKANMFLSELFTRLFVNLTSTPVELYENDGAVGAAIGAGIGAGVYSNSREAFASLKPIKEFTPESNLDAYEDLFLEWKQKLSESISE